MTDGDLIVALQARAEKAEHALEITGDARALARFRETERERDALKVANAALSDGVLAYEAKVAALEARLAEQAPVVEAAEALSDAWAKFDTFYDMHETMDNRACVDRIALLDNAVSALRAARSLRGAGEGGGA